MKALAPILGALLFVAAAATFALGVAARTSPGQTRAEARAALLSWDDGAATPAAPGAEPARGDVHARYWWSLAAFEQAVSSSGGARAERLRNLARLASELQGEASQGTPPTRSLALSMLALTRLARSLVLTGAIEQAVTQPRSAVSALRAAVVLDPGNEDAKANLEQLLRLAPPGRQPVKPRPGRRMRAGQPGKASPPSTPSPGAGAASSGAPVGY